MYNIKTPISHTIMTHKKCESFFRQDPPQFMLGIEEEYQSNKLASAFDFAEETGINSLWV